MTWTASKHRRHDRSGLTFRLHYTSDRGHQYIRNLTRTRMREFCDIATDALEHDYTPHPRFSAKPVGTNTIEIADERASRTEVLLFERTELERLITHIDQLLEDE